MMTQEQQFEQRRAILDAVAIETRKIIDKVEEVGIGQGGSEVTIDAVDAEWHISISYSSTSKFVRVTGHIHRSDGGMPTSVLAMLGVESQDEMSFDFNCPADWVPKSPLD
jgi:hypothetical protein